MEKRSRITAPLNIKFWEKSMLLLYEEGIKKEIPYTEPIVVYLAAKNIGTGEIYMPGITEITADMDGYIIIYGRSMDYELHTYKTHKTAGELFIELAAHAGQGLFGYEPWIEAVRQEFFEEAKNMISGGQDSNKES